MSTSAQSTHVPVPVLFRSAARAAGVVAIVTWLELVLFEWVKQGPPDMRNSHQALQAAVLAIVFAGYLVGWWHELAGGVLSIFGTIAFVTLFVVIFAASPSPVVAWFAAPGVLYILAWFSSHKYGKLHL